MTTLKRDIVLAPVSRPTPLRDFPITRPTFFYSECCVIMYRTALVTSLGFGNVSKGLVVSSNQNVPCMSSSVLIGRLRLSEQ